MKAMITFTREMEVLQPKELRMSYVRRRFKPDSNEGLIIEAMRWRGAIVFIIDQPFDLLVAWRGHLFLMEVKVKTGKLSPSQIKNASKLGTVNVSLHVVRSPEEALAVLDQYLEDRNE